MGRCWCFWGAGLGLSRENVAGSLLWAFDGVVWRSGLKNGNGASTRLSLWRNAWVVCIKGMFGDLSFGREKQH